MVLYLFFGAAAAAMLLGIFWVLKKVIGGMIPASFGTLFIYLGGFLIALVLSLFAGQEWRWDSSFKKGIWLAIAAGILIALFDALGIFLFRKGIDLSVLTPFVSGGAVAISVVAGFLFFREAISLTHFIGLIAVIAGIFLLSK